MSFHDTLRDLRDELRANLHDLLFAYSTRAGIDSLPATPPRAGEGKGAHPGLDGFGSSPRAEPPQGVSRPESQNLAIDAVAALTNWMGRMVVCPTCGVEPPHPCFSDGGVHPLRIKAAEADDGEVQ